MSCVRYGCRAAVRAVVIAGTMAVCACTYEKDGPPELHYRLSDPLAPEGNTVSAPAPNGNTVTVCSAHGCQHQAPFTFTDNDLRHIALILEQERSQGSPQAERKAIGQAIAWIERRVGRATGTHRDRAGLGFLGSGDPSQQDCVDEATNTTSYLLVMQRAGLLRHHKVARPYAKGNMIMGKWLHYSAMIAERATGRKYAVDSFFYANGKPPIIMAASRWYIDDGAPAASAQAPTADASTPATKPHPMDRSGLAQLVDLVLAPSPTPRPAAVGYPD